ncbi:hypothetical protein [Modestobacter sp. SSW1-42]|uniref:hypothetical protein n=1 Tax=Modestobacter sp. SSW1-42 TaxID=596372 RepID=UPI003987B64F
MRRGVRQVTAGLVALTALTGCGFLEELADPPPAPVATAAPASASASPSPVAQPPRVVLATQLSHDAAVPGGPYRGALQVSAHPVSAGLPQLGNGFAADCGLDAATARHLDLDLTFTNRSGATSVVATRISVSGPAVDADVLALVVESSAVDVRYCQDGDRTPEADRLVLGASGTVTTVTAHLVVGPDAPEDAFAGLTVELAGLHDTSAGGSGVDTPWEVARAPLTSCLDGPGGICVSVD